MSNEMKDWLCDQMIEKYQRRAARIIYNYAYEVFYGTDKDSVEFRMNYGSKGAEDKVLNFIWEEFIKE